MPWPTLCLLEQANRNLLCRSWFCAGATNTWQVRLHTAAGNERVKERDIRSRLSWIILVFHSSLSSGSDRDVHVSAVFDRIIEAPAEFRRQSLSELVPLAIFEGPAHEPSML